MQPLIDIPEEPPPGHSRNYRPTQFKYGYCSSCESLFLVEGGLGETPELTCFTCKSTILTIKDLEPPYMLNEDHQSNLPQLSSVYNEDGLAVRRIRQFPVEVWEYQYITGTMLGPNDIEWWLR